MGTLALTALAVAYLAWKIELPTTLDVLAETDLAWFAASVAIMVLTIPVLAARWSWLLRAQRIEEGLAWLTRAYFVAYAAGQILPTSLGGDAVRIVETARRHGGQTAVATGTVVLERGLGGAATVLLGAIAFVLSIGRFDVSAYLWLEGVFVFGTILLAFLFLARSARPLLRVTEPWLERVRLDRVLRAFYESVHHYRGRPRLLLGVFAVTFAVQTVRVLAIWAAAKAVGIDLEVLVYYVMGPLLFLVLLVPFTLNGIAVREAFFVSFLGSLGVGAEQAFAAGFLFFLVTLIMALPGAVILLWEGLRRGTRTSAPSRKSLDDPGAREASSARTQGGSICRHIGPTEDAAMRRFAAAQVASDFRDGALARKSSMAEVSVVVVTYDALPWIEQCLASAREVPTLVVDNGSSDGTVAFVRDRFPDVIVIESENLGLAAGWNAGIRETDSRYVLLLNADAWLVGDALRRLVDCANAWPRAAFIGPRLSNPDGTLQRSVRGFPTLWRLATEYLGLRKLAPRTRTMNAFYAGGFAHDEEREVESVMGSCMLVLRPALAEIGLADESFFLFSEETDWHFRARQAGWEVVFSPGAECVHVRGASHAGRLYRENLRGHLRFFLKHRGARQAEWARRLLLGALRVRGAIFRGERARAYREAAAWLASGDVAELLRR
ncbi:MAG: flippase-like domain-containing protein [Actinomycetota bacterium]|nr:flippase-like domain-containing protein [Actinomycetota bacterium]